MSLVLQPSENHVRSPISQLPCRVGANVCLTRAHGKRQVYGCAPAQSTDLLCHLPADAMPPIVEWTLEFESVVIVCKHVGGKKADANFEVAATCT